MARLATTSALIIVLTSLNGFVGWRAEAGEVTSVADASYGPKAELHVTVATDQTKSFLATVEELAAKNAFELQYNLSGLPLKDGRGIIYLMFTRPDGVEIRVANPFHREDINVEFYDKRETSAWKSVYDQFTGALNRRFSAHKALRD
jgi:hypothetical protein